MTVESSMIEQSYDVSARDSGGIRPDQVLHKTKWYSVSVDRDVRWKDAWRKCGPDGWEPWWLLPFSFLKRDRSGKWLALIVAVDDRESFVVSDGVRNNIVIQPSRCGKLRFYANDASFMYWNNRGSIAVSVRQVEDPGGQVLAVPGAVDHQCT
jgi:hypothetical protein